MFKLKLLDLVEKARFFASEYKITFSGLIVWAVLLVYMLLFITIPSIHTTGLKQLLWLFIYGALINGNIWLYEKSYKYDPETSTYKSYHYIAIAMTVVMIAILCFMGNQVQSLY